jgi:hypothetical protein
MNSLVDVEGSLESELQGFCGSENFYRASFGLIVTDGVKYLADKAQAWWLVDLIASYQPKTRPLDFQLWEINLLPGKKAEVTCKADSDVLCPTVLQKIGYTDFPLKRLKLYVRDNVLMLPGEY